MSTRKPVFSGKFYPSVAAETKKLIEYMEKKEINNLSHILKAEVQVLGGVVPHAGLIFCGYQAVHFFHYIMQKEFDTVIILSPSHTGIGPEISIDDHDEWEIPGATFTTDPDLLKSGLFPHSSEAQAQEHAAEVMLPYLSYYRPDLKNIGVITIRQPTLENSRKVGQALYDFENKYNKKILIIASSDFNHFDSPSMGRDKDDMVIEAIKNQQEEEVINRVKQFNVSVCGYGPIVALMAYARLKDDNARFGVLRRGHSGEVHPSEEVVDYVSMLCSIPMEHKK